MKVRMLTTSASPAWVRHAGAVVDVSAEEAKQLFAGRHAEPVTGKVETATRRAPENAALRTRPPEED